MKQQHNSRHFLIWVVFLIFFPISLAFAFDTPVVDLSEIDKVTVETGVSIFKRASNEVWASNTPFESTMTLLDHAEDSFSAVTDSATKKYFLAQVEIYRGRITYITSTKSRARPYFSKAMELARESVNERESSDGYRVLAAAGASWMSTKGLAGIMEMSQKVKEWSDTALELNPHNALAVVINAQGLIHAPRFAGGDPEEAIHRLSIQIKRQDLSDIERFQTILGLAQAHKKLRQKDEFVLRCNDARRIFPENRMLKGCK